MEEFTKDRYNAIAYRAKEIARGYGLEEFAEDFTQFAAMHFHRGRKATLDQMFVDYLRQNIVDVRQGNADTKKSIYFAQKGDFSSEEFCNLVLTDFNNGSSRFEPTLTPKARECQNSLKGMYRAVFTLLCHGYTLQELGDIWGVSESRMGQFVMEIKKTLKSTEMDN